MTLRAKLGIGLTMGVAVAIAVVILTARLVLAPEFAALERSATLAALNRGNDALAEEILRLDTLAENWASRDDTWNYMVQPSEAYIDSNFRSSTLLAARVSFTVVVSPAGEVVFGRAVDLTRMEAMEPPASLLAAIVKGESLPARLGLDDHVAGLIALEGGTAVVAARPVRTSGQSPPVRGILIVGRILDAALVAHLSTLTHEVLTLHSLDSGEVPEALARFEARPGRRPPRLVVPLGDAAAAGWSLLTAIDGRPVAALEVRVRREAVLQGRRTTAILIAALALCGLLLAAGGWLAINRIVLRRVRVLVADVETIGASRDLSRRVTVKGRDELAVLAAAINQTVGALEGAVLGRERSESRFAQLFESVPCGVYESSPDGRLAAVNPALVTMLGYSSAAELLRVDVGRDLYFDPEERRPFIEEMTERGEFRNVELVLRRKDGSRVVALENSRVVRNEVGKVVAFRGTLVDITERKAMENAIEAARCDLEARVTARTAELSRALTEVAEKEERFRLLIETAGSAILVLALDGRIEECNPTAEEIFASRRDEMIGADYAQRFVPEGERAAVREDLQAVMAGKVTRGFENRIVRGDGRDVVLLWNVTRLVGRDGLPCGVIAVGQDFSERKQLEEQLRHAQKMEAVGRLAGGVAHDFNNLLQAMVSSCEVLRSHAGNADAASRVVDEIKAHVARGAALTRQLLLFARRDVERAEPLDLSEAIGQAGTLLRRVIREDIRLEVRCAAEPLPVLADRGQIEQILVNLAVNATDAMPGGGVLTLVTGREQDGFAFFEVADTGEGIPAEISHRVFDPFFTTKGVGKGTGLGLSVVHGIVTRYGGTIGLDSTVGTGTRFHIRLPLTDAIIAPPSGIEFEDGVPTGAGERILVVEDEEGARVGLDELLTLLGYRVTAVASGEAALALGADERCQLLLSDVMLPGLGGPEVARALGERWPGLRIVMMSGYAEDEALRHRLGTAEMRFLQKPFDLVTVAREIASALADAPAAPEE